MEFVEDFLATYGEILDDKVGIVCQAIVSRVVADQHKKGTEEMFT